MRAAALAVLLGAAAGAGCGGEDPTPGGARADQIREAAAEAGLPEEVRDFLVLAVGSVDATYRVTYEVDEGSGVRDVTVAQAPPDHRLDVVNGDGSADTTIRLDDEVHQCRREQPDDPWECGRVDVVPPALGAFDEEALAEWAATLADRADDYDFSVETRRLVGVDASCLLTTLKAGRAADPGLGESGTLCVSPEGVVLLVDSAGSRQEATSYTTEVSDDAFALPDE
jgi:hypothetical protein